MCPLSKEVQLFLAETIEHSVSEKIRLNVLELDAALVDEDLA